MWYKIAKQGSLWNRIHPDAEEIFDRIFDNSLISTYKNQKLDIDKFNELFQQSILKSYVSKYIAQNIDNQIAGMFKKTHQEEIKKKFLFWYYTKLNEIKNAIIINPNASKNIIRLRALLKHEFTHALSNAIMPEYINEEIYVPAYNIKKKELGKTIEETNRFMKYWKLVENLHNFPYFESFLKSNYPEYTNYIDPTEDRTINKEKLKESAIKFNQFFEHFKNENTTINKNIKKIRPFDKLELKATPYELSNYQTINQIDFRDIYFETITGKLKSEFIEKDKWKKLTPEEKKQYNPTFQKFLNLLNNRAKTLRADSDLYYANPDETRSQINEYLEYFNSKNLLEFYNFKFNNNKEEFLNFIKNMFFELIDWNIRNNFPFSEQYENYLGIFFLNDIMNKQYDEKFKRQLAKHFSNTYNIIKTELDKETQLEQQNNINIDQTQNEL